MQSKRTRLDRFLSAHLSIKRKDVRLLLAQGRVSVDYQRARDVQQFVDQFTHVAFDGRILQHNVASYVMLNKPRSVVSATKDKHHPTVIQLLPDGHADDLHIVGRLDFNSTGLLLLTNDGRWSRRLSCPESHVSKRYLVSLDKPITVEVVEAFEQGIYFAYEDLTTRPVRLRASQHITGAHCAEVLMEEGRYHQIKRMFGHFQIEVLTLHRYAVGNLMLDPLLSEGMSRPLSSQEVIDIFN